MDYSPQIEQFLSYKSMNQGRADSTVSKYRGYLQRLESYLKSEQKIELFQVDSDILDEFTGIFMHKEGLAPSSRQVLIACIKGFYKWASKKGHIAGNPSRELDYPKAGRKLPDVMSLKTLETLIMAPDIKELAGIRDVAMISILGGMGLRVSGLVDLNESSLLWHHNGQKQQLIIKTKEKGDKERLVPAPTQTSLMIRAYLGHPDLAGIDRTLPNGDKVLFTSINNMKVPPHLYHGEERRLSTRYIDDMIKKYGRAADLPKKELHAHAFRHRYGTELAEDGLTLSEIQILLGHADPKTSMIYIQLATSKLAEAVNRASPMAKIKTPVSGLEKIVGN